MRFSPARLVIAGAAGDSGKTIVAAGLLCALRARGLEPAPFKKGPDYIDAAWLSRAAGLPCRNLDTYLQPAETILSSFADHASSAISLVEGSRGLLDGMDLAGTHSTASLARLLGAPVLLVVNAAKATRTVAAVVKGCMALEPDTDIRGVVLNRVAGPRHEDLVRRAVEELAGVEVVGVLPRLGDDQLLPDRHLGLVPPEEHPDLERAVSMLGDVAAQYLDLDRILEIARSAPPLAGPTVFTEGEQGDPVDPPVRVGYFSDSAFTFYYPENLEALQRAGSILLPISPLKDPALPEELDALYLGGGFPETHAARLTQNRALMAAVAEAVEEGMPLFAECGGMIYLSRSLLHQGKRFPMAGVLPLDLEMCERPQGLGYMELEVERENPLFKTGTVLRGHEFHYTRIVPSADNDLELSFRVKRGTGALNQRDGVVYKNVLAGYMHLHALGTPQWAPALVGQGARYRRSKAVQVRRR